MANLKEITITDDNESGDGVVLGLSDHHRLATADEMKMLNEMLTANDEECECGGDFHLCKCGDPKKCSYCGICENLCEKREKWWCDWGKDEFLRSKKEGEEAMS